MGSQGRWEWGGLGTYIVANFAAQTPGNSGMVCSASLECPPGYRLIAKQDLAVGKIVLYIRSTGEHIHTNIVDAKTRDDRIKLEAKSQAQISRIFVPDEAAGGAEATGSATAAVGAVASAENGAGEAVPPPPHPSIAAATNEADVPTITHEQIVDTDKFLRVEVVSWMSSLGVGGSSLVEGLAAALAALAKSPDEMVQAFKAKVPWTQVPFTTMPKSSKKAGCTFRCCHINHARTQLMACSWEMPSCSWKRRGLLVLMRRH